MTQDELKAWAVKNGWQMIAGHPSLTKPSAPKEAIVRMVLKATVVHVEVKKPAGEAERREVRQGGSGRGNRHARRVGAGDDPGVPHADAGEPRSAGVCENGTLKRRAPQQYRPA